MSGIGNIYADEALWTARMHYARPTRTMSRTQAAEVITAAADVMRSALEYGGTSFDALYVNINGSSGYFDRSLAVYGREGEPCPRCGTPIRREPFMNRSSYRCPALPASATRRADEPFASVGIARGGRRARCCKGERDARAAPKISGYCLTVVERLKHYLLVRHGHNWVLLFRFALVGASGVVVNLFVAIMCKKLGPDENGIFLTCP